MNQMRQKAFTLIEMLVVVIILGVILAIAIPSVRNIIYQNKTRLYQAYMSIVDEKTKLFMNQYRGEFFSNEATCFQVNYQDLLKNNFITETDIHCNGNILITKDANQRDLSAEYYLSCVDNNQNSLHQSEVTPSGCTIFSDF